MNSNLSHILRCHLKRRIGHSGRHHNLLGKLNLIQGHVFIGSWVSSSRLCIRKWRDRSHKVPAFQELTNKRVKTLDQQLTGTLPPPPPPYTCVLDFLSRKRFCSQDLPWPISEGTCDGSLLLTWPVDLREPGPTVRTNSVSYPAAGLIPWGRGSSKKWPFNDMWHSPWDEMRLPSYIRFF